MAERLGYDPHSELRTWRGTPIPPVDMPLVATPERLAIAGNGCWWHGPPWTILRNGPQFVRQVVDFAGDDAIAFILQDIPQKVWREALVKATPGSMSKGSYVLWSLRFGLMHALEDCNWLDNAHVKDLRPFRSATREQLYARHAAAHLRRVRQARACDAPV